MISLSFKDLGNDPFFKRVNQRTLLVYIVGILVYVSPILLMFRRVILHPTTSIIGGNIDSVQFMWYLGWFWHAVSHGIDPLVSNAMNAPSGINLMDNTSIVAEAILFGPIVYLLNGPIAFNLMYVLTLLSNAVLGGRLIRKLGFGRREQLIGGLLFELIPYSTAQSQDGHINLVLGETFFLLVLYILNTLSKSQNISRPLRVGSLLGIVFAAEFYTSSEVFATTVLVVVVSGLVAFCCIPQVRYFSFLREVRLHIAYLTTLTVLLLPGIWMMFFGPNHFSLNFQFMSKDTFVSDIGNFVVPGWEYLIHDHLTSVLVGQMSPSIAENDAYIGLPALVLLLWLFLRFRKNRVVVSLGLSTVIITVLSLGPELHVFGHHTGLLLPWTIIQALPLLGQALPSRLMMYSDVYIVILLVYGFSRIDSRWFTGILIAVTVAWMPIGLPAQRQFSLPAQIQDKLLGNRTTFISSSYYDDDRWLFISSDARYRIPVTNVYAFPYTVMVNHGSQLYSSMLNLDAYSKLSESDAVQYITSFVRTRHPVYLLYPGNERDLPSSLIEALDHLYGPPSVISKMPLWVVSKSEL